MIKSRATGVEIASGAEFSVPIVVQSAGARIAWCFEVAEEDIGFRIERSDGSSVEEPRLVPAASPQCGEVPVAAPAVFRFIWDNSFSLFSSKRIFYSVCVHQPRASDASERLSEGLSLLWEMNEASHVASDRFLALQREEAKAPAENSDASLPSDPMLMRRRLEELRASIRREETGLSVLSERYASSLVRAVLQENSDRIRAFDPQTPLGLVLGAVSAPPPAVRSRGPRSASACLPSSSVSPESQLASSVSVPPAAIAASESPQIALPAPLSAPAEEEADEEDPSRWVALPPTRPGASGWYYTPDGDLFYCLREPEQPDVGATVGPFRAEDLQELIDLAGNSSVLIACPGTEQGASGLYVNRTGVVTRWSTSGGRWEQLPL